MATIIANNIISPLGFTTEANYEAVIKGKTALCHYDSIEGVPFPFTAALFSEEQKNTLLIEGYTMFESLAIHSIKSALSNCTILIDKRTALIISSTKSNVELLGNKGEADNVVNPGVAARKIAQAIGICTMPIVVCNACISGVSAIILGERLLKLELYDHIIVCGVDRQSPFIISGFYSLKALSEEPCKPFDIERIGLNLGESAATIILSRTLKEDKNLWHIRKGATRNDAFHITNPSPQGDGCYESIMSVTRNIDINSLALINAHGTATMYNDQMEAKAIKRAGLSHLSVNALKGYFGHTMGTAGILETILTMHSIDKGIVLGTKGFEEIGVSGGINVHSNNILTQKSNFIKIISGFGGCNAAIHLSHEEKTDLKFNVLNMNVAHKLYLTPRILEVDNVKQEIETKSNTLNWLYKNKIGNYPKYYKMDGLARLGFIASEIILTQENQERFIRNEKRAVILFNKSGTIHADKEYLETISDTDNYFPSPSEFVYTLPNIVNGEIAIRNGYCGETCFYILPEKNTEIITRILQASFLDENIETILAGWIEYHSDENFETEMYIINK
ncbi:MAG: 3-oxoacyl-ACP synthase [Bacteroidaceae bacterium]|nr:3-oxoacyl-ACP synthase [Bacteroidaceae bacterium]